MRSFAAQFYIMNFRKLLWFAVIAAFLTGCGAPKVLTTKKTDAENFEAAQNYTQATEAWKLYFDQTDIEKTSGEDFAHAAKTAFKSGNVDLALSWFDQARYKNYADFEMYKTLAEIFKEKKNISKELSALEYISENYSDKQSEIDSRLYDVYVEIESPEKALQVWERLNEQTKSELPKLESYFVIQKDLKNDAVCDSVAGVILKQNPEDVKALEWFAEKYYWRGENRYKREMAKYEKKKTNKQYKILLKELDKATADFKRSLKYFNKLWKIEPGKKYASYFANIYARFGDKKKSDYYKKYMK